MPGNRFEKLATFETRLRQRSPFHKRRTENRHSISRVQNSATLQELMDIKQGLDFHNIISITDKKGRILEVNDTFCQISGYRRDELIGRTHRIVNSGVHSKYFFIQMWRTISKGLPWRGEVCNRAKNGALYWVESSIVPILDVHGRPEKYISIRTDVTHLKQTEKQLLEAQSLARLGHWELELATGILEWSDTVYQIFGVEKGSVIPSRDLFRSMIHPEDLEFFLDTKEAAVQSGLMEVVHRIIRMDGEVRYVKEVANYQYDQNGQPHRLVGAVQDITKMKLVEAALRESEERFNLSHKFANIGTWAWHVPTGELYWSEQIGPMFDGSGQALETSYENFVKALHPDDRTFVLDSIQETMAGKAEYDLEHRVIWSDGSIHWLHERGDVVRDEEGQPITMIGVVQDISERKKSEQELIEAKLRAEQADRAKSDFLSSMSHELRTPLNSIIGFAQLLESSELNAKQSGQVRNIGQSGQHLLGLINQLLELSQIEAGQIQLSSTQVKVEDLVKSCLSTLEPMASKRQITIQNLIQTGSETPWVTVDALRAKQVLLNLVSNAVKYNRHGGEVKVHCEKAGEEFVRVLVSDTGKGIPKAKQSQVFEAYNRLGHESSSIEGTGIGLSISQKLMTLMKGKIGFTSEEGKGSTFWIELPISEMDITEVPDVVETDKETVKPESGQIRLQYIEDNWMNMQLMADFVSKHNHVELNISPNAEMGIETAKEWRPDLILLDINLPGMSGDEALPLLQQLPELQAKQTRIYAVTSEASPEKIEQRMQLGFDGYFTKPLDLEALSGLF